MELVIALILFIGMIALWFTLPGSVDAHVVAQHEPEGAGHTALGELA